MNLHDEPGAEARVSQPIIHSQHRQLNDVSGCALHRRVDRRALSGLLALTIPSVDFRKI